jgi:outer membrane receptor protein involved in Fe transport
MSDPDAATTVRTINVVNTALKPWTASNYDLTVETYEIKGATASLSLFQKDLSGFFAATRTTATKALVESYDVPWEDFYSGYEVVSTRNGGNATLKGLELSYRQSLFFLPAWAKGFQVFGNVTTMSLSGPDRASLQSFAPRNVNWGVSYSRAKFNVNVNVALQKWVRQSQVAASATVSDGTYQYQRNSPRVDTSFEYNFTKRIGIYGGVRNLLAVPNARVRTNQSGPSYTLPNQYQYNFALVTLGIKGAF